MNILIIGLGSIAKKHISVLNELYKNITFYSYKRNIVSNKIPIKNINYITDFNELKNHNFKFLIISSPSSLHYEQIIKFSSLEIPMFIEKPVFTTKNQLKNFNVEKLPINYVACNFRFNSLVVFLKKYLFDKIDLINEVNVYCGSYLPHWRPNTDYSKSYSSIKKLGGGVHLDLIHEPDYICYLFGLPKKYKSIKRKYSKLNIDSFDFSNIFFEYENFPVNINLNYYRIDKKREIEILMDDKTILADFETGSILDISNDNILYIDKNYSINQSYIDQMKYFIKCIDNKKNPMNNINEAISILNLIL